MQAEMQTTSNVINLHNHSCWRWDSDSLDALIADLASVSHATEDSFLELGSKVKLFYDRAHEISRVAGDVLQLLQGADGESTLQHLQLLVERCSLWLSATDEKSTDICLLLNNVTRQMTELYEPVDGLRKVTKTLHALRVSTRIEDAKDYASGAGVLAKSLDELGSLIYEKIAEIFDRTEALLPMINDSLAMEEAAQAGTIRTASREIEKARGLLTEFMANCIETGQWTARLSERSHGVKQNFGEMISALQFQDITRQRLDHVQKALSGLGQHLEKFSQRSDFSHDEEASRLFGRICRLQNEQLSLASQEFLDAADNLSANLHGMVASVVSMAEDTRELFHATNIGCDSRFAAVLEVLGTITDSLDKTRHVHQTAGGYLTDVCQGIQEVAGLVEEVEMIGEEIQLLAMNAAINAAHSRQQGAGLDIIAQNIHVVAEEASRHALVLARECATITSHAIHLQDVNQETQDNTGSVGALLEDAQERMATIEANCLKLMEFATEVDQATASLSSDVNEVVNTIDVQKSFQEKLAPAFERFELLSSSTDEEVTESDNANLEALFIDLEHCYTMDSERQVHRRFIDKDDPLQSVVTNEEDVWSANRDHGLGDNIDLF
jgi:methyl-accepting chemotaxis protein